MGRILRHRPNSVAQLRAEFESHFQHGGCFVRHEPPQPAPQTSCDLILVHPDDEACTLAISAEVVWVGDAAAGGVGLSFRDFDDAMRASIARFVGDASTKAPDATEPPVASAEPKADQPDAAEPDAAEPDAAAAPEPDAAAAPDPVAPNVSPMAAVRGIGLAEQQRIAKGPDVAKRMALERTYGKAVWPLLLKNQSLTVPEVTRLARMGQMPKPLLEQIASNAAWTNNPQVRRALLQNPRLGRSHAERILRALPHQELRQIAKGTAYPAAIRQLAQRMFSRG